MTPREGKRWKRALERDITKRLREQDREKLARLRGAVRDAKRRRTTWLRAASRRYRKLERQLRTKQRERRARVLAALKQRKARELLALRADHLERRERIRAKHAAGIQRAEALLEEERRYQAEHRAMLRTASGRARAQPKATKRERRAESLEQVRHNVAPDLRPVFDWVLTHTAVMRKPRARMTRTEQFERWVEENPELVAHARAELEAAELPSLEAELAEREAAYYAELARSRAPARAGRARAAAERFTADAGGASLDDYLAAVPF